MATNCIVKLKYFFRKKYYRQKINNGVIL